MTSMQVYCSFGVFVIHTAFMVMKTAVKMYPHMSTCLYAKKNSPDMIFLSIHKYTAIENSLMLNCHSRHM